LNHQTKGNTFWSIKITFKKYTIMKKLSIIAGLVFTTTFFASCENNQVVPRNIISDTVSQPADFVEPEFVIQKGPSVKALENTIVPAPIETVSGVENKLEQ
jgi:PBP1b-binding outer membrane lipoprotein LpoB